MKKKSLTFGISNNVDVWFVVYEIFFNTDSHEQVLTHFVGGFPEERDAQAFLKLKKREKADSIKRGWTDFFIEVRPRFE